MALTVPCSTSLYDILNQVRAVVAGYCSRLGEFCKAHVGCMGARALGGDR